MRFFCADQSLLIRLADVIPRSKKAVDPTYSLNSGFAETRVCDSCTQCICQQSRGGKQRGIEPRSSAEGASKNRGQVTEVFQFSQSQCPKKQNDHYKKCNRDDQSFV
ncbi:MAG: hypothetical protein D4R77_12195 [Planctomycetaceae bacterium]|nr:MAG: hypothetical protein D4R77_12195 [Planctomycetaceae bacterium]